METLLQIKQSLNSRKALFISFEGGEGVGKSTQIDFLKKDLLNKQLNVVSTREPGGTKEAEELRKFLVTGDKKAWDPYSESLIFNAIRREHINKIIFPAIKDGAVVLCDRFIDSTIVYQGLVGEVSKKDLLELHRKYCYNLYPDITFFLDLSPQKGLNRALKRQNTLENRFENLGINYHKKIFNGFDDLQKKNPNRIIRINADNSKETIASEISSFTKKLLNIND
jgi:dTMP kinase